MTRNICSSGAKAYVKLTVKDFLESRKFTDLIEWMKKQLHANDTTILSESPPNHTHDLPDGTMNVCVGTEAVRVKQQQHETEADGPFPFTIVKVGPFAEVLKHVGTLRKKEEQMEAAMAFYVAAHGEFLSSSPEWRRLTQKFGLKMPELLNNPFYRGVCEELLKVFREQNWI